MRAGRRPGRAGASLLELLVLLALLAVVLAGAVGSARRALARSRAETGARRLASDVRRQRSLAIATATARALSFERDAAGEWTVGLLLDGDGDGIRASDVALGIDAAVEGPEAFAARYGGVRLGFLPTIDTLRSPPPGSTPLGALTDPVRLGLSDVLVLTTRGSTTSGTLYLTDGTDRQFAVVVYGMTGRSRTWEYEARARQWRERS